MLKQKSSTKKTELMPPASNVLLAQAHTRNVGEVFYRTIDGVLAMVWMAVYLVVAITILTTGWKPLGISVPTSDAIAGLCLPIVIALAHIRQRIYYPISQRFNIWSAISTTAFAVIPAFIRFGA